MGKGENGGKGKTGGNLGKGENKGKTGEDQGGFIPFPSSSPSFPRSPCLSSPAPPRYTGSSALPRPFPRTARRPSWRRTSRRSGGARSRAPARWGGTSGGGGGSR